MIHVLFLAPLVLTGILALIFRRKKLTNASSRNVIVLLHFLTVAVCALALAMQLIAEYSWRGYWTEKIIAWIALDTLLLLAALFDPSKFSKALSYYVKGVLITMSVVILMMVFLPVGGHQVLIGLYSHLTGAKDDIRYKDDTHRVEEIYLGPMSPPRMLEVIEARGLLEKTIASTMENPFNAEIHGATVDSIQNLPGEVLLYHHVDSTVANPFRITKSKE